LTSRKKKWFSSGSAIWGTSRSGDSLTHPRSMQARSSVLVTVDCLRADRLGFRGYSRPLAPFLDALAQQSIVFSSAVAAGAPTYFSFPAIMASRYPLSLGREVVGVAPGEPTIATVLQESGYETGAFLAGNPYLTARLGYAQGFGQFSDFLHLADARAGSVKFSASPGFSRFNRALERLSNRTKLTAAAYNELYFRYCQWRSGRERLSMDQLRRYPAANVVVDAACDWLKERSGRPFFLWIHLMDPHHPYYPPPEAMESLGMSHITPKYARFLNSVWNRGDLSPRRLQRYRKEVMALYDAGVHWVDRQLARLVEFLKAHNQWDDTVFLVTADHGEEFLEHGNRYHSPVGLAEQLIRVPILIHAPGSSAARVTDTFSLIHLAPTLLEGLGVEIPHSFRGRALWNDLSTGKLPGSPAIVECVESCNNQFSAADRCGNRLMVVLDGDHKLVLRFREQSDSLYDLARDPEERRPLPDTVETKNRARLLECARDYLRYEREHRDQALALRARLRELRHHVVLKSAPVEADKTTIETAEHG